MNRSLRPVAGCLLWFAASLLASGCASSADKPEGSLKGKVLNKGQPYQAQLPPGGRLPPGEEPPLPQIIFYPITSEKQAIVNSEGEPISGGVVGHLQADGSFEILVGKKALAPGKYRIVIKHIDPRSDSDLLKGKFNEKNSKINRDIKSGDEIVIDLSKPSG